MVFHLPVLSEVACVAVGVWRWAGFSPHHRVELAAHLVCWEGVGVAFDPLPLSTAAWLSFPASARPAFIVATNENHERDQIAWSERFPGARLIGFTSPQAPAFPMKSEGANGDLIPGWRSIPLPGGAEGETAYHCPGMSLMVFGDAMIHLRDRGLEVLPDKYCRDSNQLRASLRALPSFERALFAHGDPLLAGAGERIQLEVNKASG